jgi:hypothetical protein
MASMTGTDVVTYSLERPGMSAFVLEDGVVYHTYSSCSRGVDALWGISLDDQSAHHPCDLQFGGGEPEARLGR